MTTLTDLEAAGAYVVAGFVDIYEDGAHKRLAQLTAGGDLLFTVAGDAFVAAMAAPELPEPEKGTEVKAKRTPKAKPAVDTPPGNSDLSDELGALAGQLGS